MLFQQKNYLSWDFVKQVDLLLDTISLQWTWNLPRNSDTLHLQSHFINSTKGTTQRHATKWRTIPSGSTIHEISLSYIPLLRFTRDNYAMIRRIHLKLREHDIVGCRVGKVMMMMKATGNFFRVIRQKIRKTSSA